MNPHFTTGLFLHSLNPTEKENFSEIFRGHGKGPVAWNELKGLYNSAWILQCFLLLFKLCPLFLVHRKKQFMKLICSFQITVFDQIILARENHGAGNLFWCFNLDWKKNEFRNHVTNKKLSPDWIFIRQHLTNLYLISAENILILCGSIIIRAWENTNFYFNWSFL